MIEDYERDPGREGLSMELSSLSPLWSRIPLIFFCGACGSLKERFWRFPREIRRLSCHSD